MTLAPLLGSTFLFGLLFSDANYWQGHLILFMILSIPLMTLAWCPTTALALAAGYLFGPTQSFLLIPAYLMASLLAYSLARLIDRGSLIGYLQQYPKTGNLIQAMQKESIWIVILCRISPILPFAMMNVLMAALALPKRVFLFGSLLGMLPRTCLFVLAGWQAQTLQQALNEGSKTPWMGLASLALILISILGISIYFKRLWNKIDA